MHHSCKCHISEFIWLYLNVSHFDLLKLLVSPSDLVLIILLISNYLELSISLFFLTLLQMGSICGKYVTIKSHIKILSPLYQYRSQLWTKVHPNKNFQSSPVPFGSIINKNIKDRELNSFCFSSFHCPYDGWYFHDRWYCWRKRQFKTLPR